MRNTTKKQKQFFKNKIEVLAIQNKITDLKKLIRKLQQQIFSNKRKNQQA